MKKVRIGVVGLGNLGELHVRHLQNKIADSEVVAVCDVFSERVAAIQKEYEVPAGYTVYDEMLEKEDLDAVAIVTNVQTHKELIIKACDAKLHIFCEKPLSLVPDECKEIEKKVEENNTKIFTLGFMRRFDPSHAEAMERIRSGEIGKPILFKSTSLDGVSVIDELLDKCKKGAFHPWFFEMGIHDCDLSRWFLGSEVACAYATGGAYVREEFADYDDYDNGVALATMENGTCATIHVGKAAACSHIEAEIIGTKGSLRINAVPRRNRMQIYKDGYIAEQGIVDFLERWEEAFYLEMSNFIDCVLTGRKPEITVYDGTKSLEMAIILHKSYMEKTLIKK
ncbi:Gfo/Idh/MocA family oxidoreductase [Anaerovorax odorimutans]|nr:Gfo/Idh/MocA family oxidoreductase [Anaerovorax odorimutans]